MPDLEAAPNSPAPADLAVIPRDHSDLDGNGVGHVDHDRAFERKRGRIAPVVHATELGTHRRALVAGAERPPIARITVPVLLVGGTEDVDVPIGNNQIAFDQIVNAPRVYKVDVIGANHTHFASVCTFGELLLSLGISKENWPSVGAADLIQPYDATCGPGAFPIDEASRLSNLYAVAFFKRHLQGTAAYEQYLTPRFADGEPAISISVR